MCVRYTAYRRTARGQQVAGGGSIAVVVVISVALLGWHVLVGDVVTITGSTAGLTGHGQRDSRTTWE